MNKTVLVTLVTAEACVVPTWTLFVYFLLMLAVIGWMGVALKRDRNGR